MAAALKIATPASKSLKTSTKTKVKVQAKPEDHLKHYAHGGVALLTVLSASLNAYANSQHASVVWAGAVMGACIPAIILVLGKVAGLQWKRNNKSLAYFTGGTGISLLLLSVYHCSESIAMLTGSPLALAIPLAVSIDVGFIALELAALMDE